MTLHSYSQDFYIGGILGATVFGGDYPSYRLKDSFKVLASPGFGVFFGKPINEKLDVKASIYTFHIKGDDNLDPARVGFHTVSIINRPNIEAQFSAQYAPFTLWKGSKLPISFFVSGGFGFSKTTISDSDISDKCPVINLIVPLGMGLKTTIKENYHVFAQLEYVQGLNDCIDGVADFKNRNDTYSSFKIGIARSITPVVGNGKSIGCPTFK